MLKKSVLLTLLFFSFGGAIIFAQKTTEFGLFLGRSYYNGEINPSTHWGNDVGSFTYGAAFRYNLNKRYSLKATLVQTKLSAEDELADIQFNTFRKASFETKLTEFAGTIEFNFLPYQTGDKKHFFSPYLFVGFSIYKYKPSISIEGPLSSKEDLSGGGTKLAMPFGPGIKLSLGRKFSLALEWGFRRTSNDAIDGLPNRSEEIFELGKSYDNDWYTVSGFMLTYKLTNLGPCPATGF